MRVVFRGELPPQIQEWLDERHRLGQDDFDEIWEGDHHIPPPLTGRHARTVAQLMRGLSPYADRVNLTGAGHCAIGTDEDYRVADMILFRTRGSSLEDAHPAVVVEVTLPNDETRRKLGFYHRQGVEELLIVDPDARTVEWFARGPDDFVAADGSSLLGITSAELSDLLDWPD